MKYNLFQTINGDIESKFILKNINNTRILFSKFYYLYFSQFGGILHVFITPGFPKGYCVNCIKIVDARNDTTMD